VNSNLKNNSKQINHHVGNVKHQRKMHVLLLQNSVPLLLTFAKGIFKIMFPKLLLDNTQGV
jgi:hypothetical protein